MLPHFIFHSEMPRLEGLNCKTKMLEGSTLEMQGSKTRGSKCKAQGSRARDSKYKARRLEAQKVDI